jgi:hypothetical protein
MGDSLVDLWKMNLTDRMLALLRWDDPADGGKPSIFGPRADSQDCWILLSDSVKNKVWNKSVFDFPLGQAGCDNAFAGHMLRQRFVLSNPSMTFQTFHLHNSNIRNYDKKNYIRSDLYLNLVPTYIIDTKQEQVPDKRPQSICNELVCFEVQSNSMSNEITYCTMLEKEGRYKWEPSVENHYFEPAIPVYTWKQACVTSNGLVYDPYTIYIGKHADKPEYNYWKNAKVDIFTPLQKCEQLFAIPFEDDRVFHHPHTYLLQYVSRCARLLKEYPGTSFWIPNGFAPYLEALDWNSVGKWKGVEWGAGWAEKVIGFLPSPSSSELGLEDIQMLRSMLPSWKPAPSDRICVIVSDTVLSSSFIQYHISSFLHDWTIHTVTSDDLGKYDLLVGASLCILVGGQDTQPKWSSLWALPQGCCVIEFQQELDMNGEFQHLCHMAQWKSWILFLEKGPVSDVQQQVMEQLRKWYTKNRYEIR